jgi:hypothetical protein
MGRLGKTGWVVGAGVLVATYDLGALGSALVALRGQWHLSAGDSSLLGVLTLKQKRTKKKNI